MAMFKRKSETKTKQTNYAETAPESRRVASEAEAVIKRGERIKKLAEEIEMWRKFSSGCRPGRRMYEGFSVFNGDGKYRLEFCMDEDTALLWAAFANQMAAERERRLRDALGQ